MLLHIQNPRDRAIVAFAATVVIAWLMRWGAGDLMWGVWASSVTYGYAYGVVLIVANPEEADAGDGSHVGTVLGIVAFFTFIFLLFHYWQGIVLNMVFPITPLEGWALLLYPFTAISWYWGVIVTTFYSRWHELKAVTRPSDDPHRLLLPFKNIVRMQILVFVFLFLASVGLIRFAVYPVLVFYFFPFPIIGEKLKYWFGKLEDRMNTPPPDEFDEV